MAQQDRIALKISEAELAEVLAAITTLNARLLPHLKTLTANERMEVPKMGDKTVAFVEKALVYAQQNPSLVPSFLDVPALVTDLEAVATLRDLTRRLVPVTDALNDSAVLSGAEAYQGALVFYSNVKNAARVKAPGAQTIADDLASRFPGTTAKKQV